MRMLRTAIVVILAVLLLAGASAAGSKTIAHVGKTLTDAGVYLTKDMYGSPDYRISSDTKVVVLSYDDNVVRLLTAEGDEVFVPRVEIEIGDRVTLKQAFSKIQYFERMKSEAPWNAAYFDQLSAPWVALVARELAKFAKEGLPEPEAYYTSDDTPPTIKVTNSTRYKVRVYLTGPRTLTRLIASNTTWSEQVPQGEYRVLAEAVSGNVIPLRTTWKLGQGYTHSIKLYIETRKVWR